MNSSPHPLTQPELHRLVRSKGTLSAIRAAMRAPANPQARSEDGRGRKQIQTNKLLPAPAPGGGTLPPLPGSTGASERDDGSVPPSIGMKWMGQTALHCSADANYTAAAAMLLECAAPPDVVDAGGWTGLHYAARRGATELVELLLQYKASVYIHDSSGKQPLHIAATHGHVEAARLLLAAGAPVGGRDKEARTPLHFAVVCKDDGMVRLLLQHGGSLWTKDAHGVSAYSAAVKHNTPATEETSPVARNQSMITDFFRRGAAAAAAAAAAESADDDRASAHENGGGGGGNGGGGAAVLGQRRTRTLSSSSSSSPSEQHARTSPKSKVSKVSAASSPAGTSLSLSLPLPLGSAARVPSPPAAATATTLKPLFAALHAGWGYQMLRDPFIGLQCRRWVATFFGNLCRFEAAHGFTLPMELVLKILHYTTGVDYIPATERMSRASGAKVLTFA